MGSSEIGSERSPHSWFTIFAFDKATHYCGPAFPYILNYRQWSLQNVVKLLRDLVCGPALCVGHMHRTRQSHRYNSSRAMIIDPNCSDSIVALSITTEM